MKGLINSIETMGLVDGPGIRVVVFLQGCNLRCMYCHNPETWNLDGGYKIDPETLVRRIYKYKNYFINEGGVTFSGGEPLIQHDFLLETLKLCKKMDIHTCIDTSGYADNYEDILKYVDLILLDIKGLNNEECEKITGKKIDKTIKFLKKCNEMNKDIWIRSVIVPGINDNKEYIKKLSDFLKPFKNIKKIELLPYHDYAIKKYEKLNIPYRLKNTNPMEKEKCDELYEYLLKCI